MPDSDLEPSFDTTPPHDGWPSKTCYEENPEALFCDDFDTEEGEVASGLWQFQRNQVSARE